MSKVPKIAVLGCGYWGKNHVRNFSQLGALAMVCDPSEAARKTAAELAPEACLEPDFAAAFAAESIQGVVLATPAETHADLAVAALQAGKDVLSEKPLAMTVAEAERMIAVSAQQERLLMVGHILEFHGAVGRLKSLAHNGELGALKHINSQRLSMGKIRAQEDVLWSFAPHDFAMILGLMQAMPTEATCQLSDCLGTGRADIANVDFRFANGATAHVTCSWLNPDKVHKLSVVGDAAMAVFEDSSATDKLRRYPHTVSVDNGIATARKAEAEAVDFEVVEPLKMECQHFLDCIVTRERPQTDGAHGLAVLKMLHACSESARRGGSPVAL